MVHPLPGAAGRDEDEVMGPDELLRRLGDNLSVRRVFGEPVERDGTTVIPVAMVVGGGGGGADARDQEAGGGFGLISRGVGVYVIRAGEVRYVPASDHTLIFTVGLLVASRVAVRALRRRRA